ncbi:uncharacterized protein LOC141825014 isoform X2 [Curcuma longa]|uniref:uncharacterized protein LOC141825014 isoform X2 n=1 Tax=Curcuma longa TaxID=136217 RepID=UPI003D9E2A8C
MAGDGSGRSTRLLLFLLSVSLNLIAGLSENPSPSKDSTTASNHSSSGHKTGLKKRKREEQHARLLKLFEEDNELEVELGLRD